MGKPVFGTELRQRREDAKLSRSELSRSTVRVGDMGISHVTIEKLEMELDRKPDDRTVLLLGEELAKRGQNLLAYRLAQARQKLDERQVGYEHALTHLDQIESALRRVAEESAGDGGRGRTNGASQRLADLARRQQNQPPRASPQEPDETVGNG